MIRLALPKGRNLGPVRASLSAVGVELEGFDPNRLVQVVDGDIEVFLLKDWDLPLYVEFGIADCGFVGSDVLEETQADLLHLQRVKDGRSRLSLINTEPEMPSPQGQVRVATRYPSWSQRLLAERNWNAEVLELSGSIELGPILNLTDIAVDIVQTGRTLRDHQLHELEVLAEVCPMFVANRASFHAHRERLSDLMRRFEEAGVVS